MKTLNELSVEFNQKTGKNAKVASTEFMQFVYSELSQTIGNLEQKNLKLKSLILLTDPVVGHVEMNEVAATQWGEYVKCYPDDGEVVS